MKRNDGRCFPKRGRFMAGDEILFSYPRKDFATTLRELRGNVFVLHEAMRNEKNGEVHDELRLYRNLLALAADHLQHAGIICRAYARDVLKEEL